MADFKKTSRSEMILNTAGQIYNKIMAGPGSLTEDQRLLSEIAKARSAWVQAETLFNEATDKTLIDHAIYDMMAAKTRYSYLLQTAKERGVHANVPSTLE